jgi:hypothetical protein
MPEICRFQGIRITMYHNEHGIPHFHARYGDKKAAIALDGTVLAGSLPSGVLALVREWALIRSDQLQQHWQLATDRKPLPPIAPL